VAGVQIALDLVLFGFCLYLVDRKLISRVVAEADRVLKDTGFLGIVDFDVVDHSNLQRQVIHGTSWVGKPKIESAKARILEINPHCHVDLYETALTSENALDIVRPYDIVCDAKDKFPTRSMVNDACVLLGKPNVYGSIFRFEGQATVFNHEGGPNYRDLFPEPPPPGLVPTCSEAGVLGAVTGVMGTLQATEVLKLILGIGEPLIGKLLLWDALDARFRTVRLKRDPACALCGPEASIHDLSAHENAAEAACRA
jgi:adenylyltransferase/sulfurtransferase